MKKLCCFALAALFLALAAPASAHTFLEQSWPRANASTVIAPTQLRLRFTERVEPALAQVRLNNAQGQAIALGAVSVATDNRRTLIVALNTPLPAGGYDVSWRVVSADGHASEGAFHFVVAP